MLLLEVLGRRGVPWVLWEAVGGCANLNIGKGPGAIRGGLRDGFKSYGSSKVVRAHNLLSEGDLSGWGSWETCGSEVGCKGETEGGVWERGCQREAMSVRITLGASEVTNKGLRACVRASGVSIGVLLT